jgi:trimethylamine---corrinoid protein Co-methyltransferase
VISPRWRFNVVHERSGCPESALKSWEGRFLSVGRVSGLVRVLDQAEMKLLHRSALRVLAEVGMRIEHEVALEALAAAGCRVDFDGQVVLFPPEVVEHAVARMRQGFNPRGLAQAQRYAAGVPMRYTAMYFTTQPRQIRPDFDVNTGGFTVFVYDLDGRRRPATLQDARDSIRLADAMDNIDLVGLPCIASEVPALLRPVVMTAELVKLTGKPGGIEAWSVKDVEYIARIAEVVAGSAEALRQRPILVGYGEARSPLTIGRDMASIFIEYIRRGFPQSLDTMPAGGTTAPATSAGTLTLGLAETLGGLTLAYALREDAVISLDMCPTLSDMRSMIYPYAGADRIPLVTAAMQMLSEFYGRPGGCHGGKTDACIPGAQAGAEKALSMLFPILAGATGIGTLGHIENALTFSYEQLVIDNEIAGYIRRMLQGFEVTEETIALDVIKEVGINGNFLAHPHTAENFRKEFWLPDLMERKPWDTWTNQKVKGLEAKSRERARKILAEHHPQPLSKEQMQAVDALVEEARRDPWYQMR